MLQCILLRVEFMWKQLSNHSIKMARLAASLSSLLKQFRYNVMMIICVYLTKERSGHQMTMGSFPTHFLDRDNWRMHLSWCPLWCPLSTCPHFLISAILLCLPLFVDRSLPNLESLRFNCCEDEWFVSYTQLFAPPFLNGRNSLKSSKIPTHGLGHLIRQTWLQQI